MSRTHKQRHKWKGKERKRTVSSDPAKIVLHRERFVERLEQKRTVQIAYRSLIFQVKLDFNPDENTTSIFYRGGVIATLPFLVERLEDCHYAIYQMFNEWNMDHEVNVLRQHVQRAKYLGSKCRLAKVCNQEKICTSSVSCPYRRWSSHNGQALCSL